jgi:molybdopterin molybdotransferase
VSVLPDYEAALSAALAAVAPLEGPGEQAGLDEAAGRVLVEPVRADRDLPPFDRAQMDGYALRAADLAENRAFPVAAVVPAGASGRVTVPPGRCAKIATGAPLPPETDTVVQHELSDRGDPVRFTVESMPAGHAVHPRGADARSGDVLVPAGSLLAPHHLAIAASVGAVDLRVARRPRTAVLTSGDEVVAPATRSLPQHQIRNSNATLATHLLTRFGAGPVIARHVPDEPAATRAAVDESLAAADLIVTVGGISAGERDYFPDAFAAGDVRLALRGAAIQPGKPVIVGRAAGGAVVVGLPGNPVSVLACACLFAWPIVRVMLGVGPQLPWRTVTLDEPVRPNPRRQAFRPACLVGDGRARVPRWAGSGDLVHTAPTDGLVRLPVQAAAVDAGTVVPMLPWP